MLKNNLSYLNRNKPNGFFRFLIVSIIIILETKERIKGD
jgi:hypothetical protein